MDEIDQALERRSSEVALGARPATAENVASPPYVYAVGRIEPRFPTSGVEKEFAQVAGQASTEGLTDRQVLQSVLTQRGHRYLARHLTWVLTIQGLETYLLVPGDPADLDLLIGSIRSAPRPTDVDVVIGVRGPVGAPEASGGLAVPLVVVDQMYSFDVDGLIAAIPRPEAIAEDQFSAAAEELYTRLMQLTDNAGATDEHRALNYLAVRYPAIYARAAEAYASESTLTGVEVRPSRLSGARRIVDVIFAFTHRRTDVLDAHFVRVDVTEMFPYLVTKLSPYYYR